MCWIPLALGASMVAAGAVLLARFFTGRGASSPELASASRTETVLVGAMLTSIGTLVLVLGLTGVICERLGVG